MSHSTSSIGDLSVRDRVMLTRNIDDTLIAAGLSEAARDEFWKPVIASGILRGN